MDLLRHLVTFALLAGVSWGQAQSDSRAVLTLEAVPPPAIDVGQIGAVITGTPGKATYYYWVVTNYNIGSSLPGGPVVVYNGPDTLSGADFITIYWPPKLHAISYDLLRTATPAFPGGTNTIAVATGIAGYSQVDNGGALGAYTLAAAPKATGHIQLDNMQYNRPRLLMHPFDATVFGDMVVMGDFDAMGDIDGDTLGANPDPLIGQVSTPVLCIVGGVCMDAASQITGDVVQDEIPWAAHDNQLEGSNLLTVDVGFGGITLDGNLTMGARSFAGLGAEPNGRIVYCSDCIFANPCAGGGTGAFAKRLNGAWRCD